MPIRPRIKTGAELAKKGRISMRPSSLGPNCHVSESHTKIAKIFLHFITPICVVPYGQLFSSLTPPPSCCTSIMAAITVIANAVIANAVIAASVTRNSCNMIEGFDLFLPLYPMSWVKFRDCTILLYMTNFCNRLSIWTNIIRPLQLEVQEEPRGFIRMWIVWHTQKKIWWNIPSNGRNWICF